MKLWFISRYMFPSSDWYYVQLNKFPLRLNNEAIVISMICWFVCNSKVYAYGYDDVTFKKRENALYTIVFQFHFKQNRLFVGFRLYFFYCCCCLFGGFSLYLYCLILEITHMINVFGWGLLISFTYSFYLFLFILVDFYFVIEMKTNIAW